MRRGLLWKEAWGTIGRTQDHILHELFIKDAVVWVLEPDNLPGAASEQDTCAFRVPAHFYLVDMLLFLSDEAGSGRESVSAHWLCDPRPPRP